MEKPVISQDEHGIDSKQKKTVKVCESNAGKDDESKKRRAHLMKNLVTLVRML